VRRAIFMSYKRYSTSLGTDQISGRTRCARSSPTCSPTESGVTVVEYGLIAALNNVAPIAILGRRNQSVDRFQEDGQQVLGYLATAMLL
jgi:Flp pilus assembly pilin Flp